MIAPVLSFAQLKSKVKNNADYASLAIIAAHQFQEQLNDKLLVSTKEDAIVVIAEMIHTDGEDEIIDEINSFRELV